MIERISKDAFESNYNMDCYALTRNLRVWWKKLEKIETIQFNANDIIYGHKQNAIDGTTDVFYAAFHNNEFIVYYDSVNNHREREYDRYIFDNYELYDQAWVLIETMAL
jgi:hypothetical protein